jgi:hypothetical protein
MSDRTEPTSEHDDHAGGSDRNTMGRLIDTSRLADGGRWIAATARRSALYRWLTAEPDPDVIVIDLRETWTVGPVIAVLDRVISAVSRGAEGSTLVAILRRLYDRTLATPLRIAGIGMLLAGIATAAFAIRSTSATTIAVAGLLGLVGAAAVRDDRSWAELADTRAVELLVAALEPPEPPESSDGSSQDGQPANDSETPQADTDEPERNPRDDAHQRVDREVADDGARGERDERDRR